MSLDAIEGWKECADCGHWDWDNMYYVKTTHKWVCFDCFQENYAPCTDCGRIIDVHQAMPHWEHGRLTCPSCSRLRESVSAKFYHECAIPLMQERGLSPELITRLMEQKRRELKNLISPEGALFILANERGINIVAIQDMPVESNHHIHSIDDIMDRLSM